MPPRLLPGVRHAIYKVRERLGLVRQPCYHTMAYSQEGEDLILQRTFGSQASGFYVDIGAHHPQRFSNTYLLYKSGWRGINVDAAPGSMNIFRKERPRDINLELAIGEGECSSRTFYIFNEPALNTFDAELAQSRTGNEFKGTILSKQGVAIRSLEAVLREYLPPGTTIDFLTVDVEGLDLEVLRSNNWKQYRPRYVLAECYGIPMSALPEDGIYQYMLSQGYELAAKTVNTLIFKDAGRVPSQHHL
ncbi:hypothetical protein BH20VER3_BH20VER3_02520 [soil metagenome]